MSKKSDDNTGQQATPYSLEAEASVLGAGLLDREALATAALIISADDFYFQRHRYVYDVMFHLLLGGEAVDIVTVLGEIKRRDQDAEVGGRDYLDSLLSMCPAAGSVESYARQVRRDSDARLMLIGVDRVKGAACNGVGPDGALDVLRTLVSKMEMRRSFATRQEADTSEEDLRAMVSKVEWLWSDHIPRGFVTALIAETGVGKSFAAMDLCYRIRCGLPWPDGTPMADYAKGGRILYVETEGRHAVFMERLDAWQGGGFPAETFIFPPNPARSLQIDNENDLEWIERAAARHHPSLIVVDSLSGSNSAAENKADEQKKILLRLTNIATTYNVALLIIHHLSKPQPGAPHWPITPSRMRGSNAVPQFCLSILALGAPDPARLNERALSCIKHNLAPDTPDLGYEILSDNGYSIGWSHQAPTAPTGKISSVEIAEDFLRETLADGPKLSTFVRDSALQQGISRPSLNRAIAALRVQATSKDSQGRNLMKLS